jgi:SAM-dependent methyltransferase
LANTTRRSLVDPDDPAYRGQADYTPTLLRLYDPIILGPIARYVWRCPANRLTERYRRHIRDRHLDVGPGTGYFLDRLGFAPGSKVTIIDPNTNVLRHTSERLSYLDVTAIEADVCKPLPVEGTFDSAALSLLIHCLPGPFERKAAAVANVAAVLSSDGVLFGSSIIGRTGSHNRVAQTLLRDYNRRSVFDNLEDSEEAIGKMLAASFEDVEVETIGSIAVFTARHPQAHTPE